MTPALLRDAGSSIGIAYAAANTSLTAGGTGDNTAITGVAIDRSKFAYAQSVVFGVGFTATLASNQTLTLKTPKIQHSADGSTGWTDFATFSDVTAATATGTGAVEFAADITGAKQFIRFLQTPDLSASGTDTAAVSCLAILAGGDRRPI